MQGAYADHILDASDVCSNCLRKNRVERVDPVRRGLGHELESHQSRDERRTTIGYAPAESVSEQKGIFCECGVEGAYERLWDPADVGEQQFKELVKAMLHTLERKHVDVNRKEAVVQALMGYREGDGIDEALANALGAGIVTAATASDDRTVSA